MTGTKYEEFFRILEENKKNFEDVENRQLAARGLKKCAACGAELPLATPFCNNCGAKQPEIQPAQPAQVTQCPNCGAALDDDVVFCANCGTKVR